VHLARDYQQLGHVARQPVNGRGDNDIAPGATAFISLASCGRSTVVPVIFSRNTFSHPPP
jgi:hypothetical protein